MEGCAFSAEWRMMFCICSTKMANTLLSVFVSMSSMASFFLSASPTPLSTGSVTAIGEDDALFVQQRPHFHELPCEHRRFLEMRHEAENGEIVAAKLLALILLEGLAQRFLLLAHGRAQI